MKAALASLGVGLAILAGVAPARAVEPVKDAETGLSIQPPNGYEARKTEGDPRYKAVYTVQKQGEVDTGCKVAFQPHQSAAAGEQQLSQDEINAFTRRKEWIDLIRATLALRYEVATVEPFEQQGLNGAAVVADFKTAEGEPKAEQVRSYLVVLDSPKGRTTVVCVGEKASFEARRREFEAIVRSVSPPR